MPGLVRAHLTGSGSCVPPPQSSTLEFGDIGPGPPMLAPNCGAGVANLTASVAPTAVCFGPHSNYLCVNGNTGHGLALMPLTEDKSVHASWPASTFDVHHFSSQSDNLDISPQHINQVILLTKGSDDIDKDERAEDCAFFNQEHCTAPLG